jgi:MFS transporter, DHA1 family, multidrug resistance protein B
MTSTSHNRVSRRARLVRADLSSFPRQFWLQAGGFFLLLTGVYMCFPFETSYMNGRMGISMTTIGLVLGVPLIAAVPFYILGGALTDRFGRKPVMAVGIAVVAGLYLTFALAGSLWQLAIAIAIEAAIGWSLFLTGSNAMVADLVRLERRA